MPVISDAQHVVEVCHQAMDAAIRAVRADAEQEPTADTQALRAYEACLTASDAAWQAYHNRRRNNGKASA